LPPPTPATYTLSLHDALPIYSCRSSGTPASCAARYSSKALARRGSSEACGSLGRRPAVARTLASFSTRWLMGLLAVNDASARARSEEHTSELQSRGHLVCRLL